MVTMTKALMSLRPNKEFSWSNDDVSTLIWHSPNVTSPTLAEIKAEFARLEEVEAKEISNREAAKATALAKLEKLGLTAEEVSAAFNI